MARTLCWPHSHPDKQKPVPLLEEAVVYADIIEPIFQTKCMSCHNSGKSKGELTMETKEAYSKEERMACCGILQRATWDC